MNFRLGNTISNIEFKNLTLEDYTELGKEKDFSKLTSQDYDEFMEPYELDPNVENNYEYHRFSIYVNNKLAGLVFADDISDIIDIRNFIGGGFIKSSYRGYGLYNLCLNIMAGVVNINTLYLVISTSNMDSIKASKGFYICSKEESENLNDIHEYIEDNESLDNYIILKKQYK